MNRYYLGCVYAYAVVVLSCAATAYAQSPEYRVAFFERRSTEHPYLISSDRLNNTCSFSMSKVTWAGEGQPAVISVEIVTRGISETIGRTLQLPDSTQRYEGINFVRDLNDGGRVLGEQFQPGGSSRQMYRENGYNRYFPPPNASNFFMARSLNNLGVFVGDIIRNDYSRSFPAMFFAERYFRLTDTGFEVIAAMNDRQSLLGYLSPSGDRLMELGIKRLGRRIERLRQLEGPGVDFINGFNNREAVVGTRYVVDPNDSNLRDATAVAWLKPQTPIRIAEPLNLTESFGVGINDSGTAVGYGTRDGNAKAFIWSARYGARLLEDVTRLDNGETPSISLISSINNRGEILAYVNGSGALGGIAILYPAGRSYPCALR